MNEIVAFEQNWIIAGNGKGIRKTVTDIQAGAMTALALVTPEFYSSAKIIERFPAQVENIPPINTPAPRGAG
jgi:hypothetical protein